MICPYCNQETEPDLRWHERGDCERVEKSLLACNPDNSSEWMTCLPLHSQIAIAKAQRGIE